MLVQRPARAEDRGHLMIDGRQAWVSRLVASDTDEPIGTLLDVLLDRYDSFVVHYVTQNHGKTFHLFSEFLGPNGCEGFIGTEETAARTIAVLRQTLKKWEETAQPVV
jgi:hypothetical protein